MSFRTALAHYLRVAARYIEAPGQLAMRRTYFMPAMYGALSQPWIQALRIATVIDIGANVGDFAFTIRPVLPNAQIYSFEPLPDCFAAMQQHLQGTARFKCFNLALGNESGEMTFQRSSHSPSSSFLKMAETHKRAFPDSASGQLTTVKIERLDTVAPQLDLCDPLLVKIDVQGYEGHVLQGGERTIRRAALVIIETSFEVLYEGQPLFDDVYGILTHWGFAYAGPVDQLCHPQDRRPLQQDSLFVKWGLVSKQDDR